MKRVTAILLGLCLLLQCLAHVAVLGLYELNKSYVAQNLCENRDKPQMKCCGKCYLRKQLRKVDDNEKPSGNTPAKTLKIEVLACILPLVPGQSPGRFGFCDDAVHTPGLQHLHGRLAASSVFHPPASCC